MKIIEVLKKLDKKYPENESHYFAIISDGSGSIRNKQGEVIIEFGPLYIMNEKLTSLYNKLESQETWEI